jgi:hypothetical protein
MTSPARPLFGGAGAGGGGEGTTLDVAAGIAVDADV